MSIELESPVVIETINKTLLLSDPDDPSSRYIKSAQRSSVVVWDPGTNGWTYLKRGNSRHI